MKTLSLDYTFEKESGALALISASEKHFEEQLFTGYDIVEFEQLFENYKVKHMTTVAVDGILEFAEGRADFKMSAEEFEQFVKYHIATCEKRELLGSSSHLLYICRKEEEVFV